MCAEWTCWTERRFWTSSHICRAFRRRSCVADGLRRQKRPKDETSIAVLGLSLPGFIWGKRRTKGKLIRGMGGGYTLDFPLARNNWLYFVIFTTLFLL